MDSNPGGEVSEFLSLKSSPISPTTYIEGDLVVLIDRSHYNFKSKSHKEQIRTDRHPINNLYIILLT